MDIEPMVPLFIILFNCSSALPFDPLIQVELVAQLLGVILIGQSALFNQLSLPNKSSEEYNKLLVYNYIGKT